MLQNGTETHRGGDFRSKQIHQRQHQEENSSSSLTSVKPMATKTSVTLENDLRQYSSFHIRNSTAQQQNTNEKTSKQQVHSRQLRPSVLRKGNQPFPQDVHPAAHDWVVDTVYKTEAESEQSDFASFHQGQLESRSKASRSSPLPNSTEHTGRHPFSDQEDLLCVKGQCRWPGCTRSKEVFKEYAHFLRHLSNEHVPGDRSIAQLRMQNVKVQNMENQLTAERQKLQAMHLHLFPAKSSSEVRVSNSMDKLGHLSGLLQPAVCQNINGLYNNEQVTADALAQGYWQISTSQVIPAIIPSFEYYKYSNIRPSFTYASMIRWAILESPEKQLTLNEIYHWFTRMFLYFRQNTATWKNAVRHNLSLHKCFVRVEGTKGSVWTVDEEEFLRRKGQKLQRDQDVGWITPYHLFPLTPQGESYHDVRDSG